MPLDFENLPESRLTHHRTTICGPVGLMSRVYCANCGCDGGLITEEWAAKCFYLCDRCSEVHGKLSTPEIPESVVRGGQLTV